MKIILSALLLFVFLSCTHYQTAQQTQPTNLNPRFPASDVDNQDLTQVANSQLLGYAGKNVLRVTVSCPASAFTLVITAVAETIPMTSAFASLGTELGVGSEKYSSIIAENKKDKTISNYVGGSVGGVAVDLTKIGYALLFDESPTTAEDTFKNAKASYPATKFLAQKFYSTDGNCGLAGRRLVDTLKEIQRRQSAQK